LQLPENRCTHWGEESHHHFHEAPCQAVYTHEVRVQSTGDNAVV
jgi:hypothetical protein